MGGIPPYGDDEDSDDVATPKAIPSTPVAELPTQTSKLPSEIGFDDRAVIDPELLGPGPRLNPCSGTSHVDEGTCRGHPSLCLLSTELNSPTHNARHGVVRGQQAQSNVHGLRVPYLPHMNGFETSGHCLQDPFPAHNRD